MQMEKFMKDVHDDSVEHVVPPGGPFHTTIWGVFDSNIAPSLLTFSHGAGKKSCTSACWLSFPVDACVKISHVSDIYYTKNRHT